jgi:hypothetical protein
MKVLTKLTYLVVVTVILAFPMTTLASASEDGLLRGQQDQIVLGGTYTLESGETLSGNLWILGGNVILEAGSRVNGDIMLLGGNVSLSGEVSGDINAMGGNIDLRSQAILRGDLNLVGGSYERNSNARIEGRVNTAPNGPFQFTLPSGARLPALEIRAYPFWDFVAFFFRAFVIAALAVLVVMFWPRHVERIGQTSVAQPITAGGIGLLTAVIAPIVLLIMTITIILIPVTLIGLVVLSMMGLLGWISIGMEVGQRMAISLKQEWATPVSAGVGTLVFTIVAGGIGEVVPCVGWVVPTLLGMLGFGAVLLTRFGTQSYPGPILPPPPLAPAGPRPQVSPPSEPPMASVENVPATDHVESPSLEDTEPVENEEESSTEAGPDPEREN